MARFWFARAAPPAIPVRLSSSPRSRDFAAAGVVPSAVSFRTFELREVVGLAEEVLRAGREDGRSESDLETDDDTAGGDRRSELAGRRDRVGDGAERETDEALDQALLHAAVAERHGDHGLRHRERENAARAGRETVHGHGAEPAAHGERAEGVRAATVPLDGLLPAVGRDLVPVAVLLALAVALPRALRALALLAVALRRLVGREHLPRRRLLRGAPLLLGHVLPAAFLAEGMGVGPPSDHFHWGSSYPRSPRRDDTPARDPRRETRRGLPVRMSRQTSCGVLFGWPRPWSPALWSQRILWPSRV